MFRAACCISWFLIATSCCSPAFATTPAPPTVVREKDGKWELRAGYLGGSRIFIMDAKRETRLLLWIKDALPKEDYEKFVHKTTAGPEWAEFAQSCFITHKGKPYFSVRTWWDQRIVLDLAAAKQVSDRELETALQAAEKQSALDALKRGVALASKPEIAFAAFERLLAGAHLAGRMKLKEAVPLLNKLEPLGFETESTLGEYGPDVDLKEGDISPQNYGTHQLRRVVQLSLRRMGETPAGLPQTSFKPRGSDKPFEPRRWDKPRAERISAIKVGMKPSDVLNTLGPPDYVETDHNIRREGPWEVAWRYDIDAKSPFTLLLIWDAHKVKTVEKFEPALWAGNQLVRKDVTPAVFDADGSIRRAKVLYTDAFRGKITKMDGQRSVAPKPRAATKNELEGEWAVIVWDFEGHWFTAADGAVGDHYRDLRVVFTADRMKFKLISNGQPLFLGWDGVEYDYKIRPGKEPKEIDVDVGEWPGIYSLRGNRLTISLRRSSGAKRPTQFEVKPNQGDTLWLLERMQK